jgi:hypothetical protein
MNQATPLDSKPAAQLMLPTDFFLVDASPLHQVFNFINPPPRSRDLGWHNK